MGNGNLGNLGNLKIGIMWDVKSFSEGAKSILSIATMTGKNLDAALKLKPFVFPLSNFDAEVKKIDSSLKKFQSTVTETKSTLTSVAPAIDNTKNSVNALDASVKKTTESKGLFRQKSVNLGADLTILSFGVQKITGDLGAFTSELGKSDRSTGKLIGSLGNATLSLLAMVPAISAIKSALPAALGAGIASVAAFSAAFVGAIATVVVTIGGFIKAITEMGTVWNNFSRLFKGDNVFDIWKDSTAALSFGLIDLRDNAASLGEMFENLKYQALQFRNVANSLNINSPTLGADIEKKYKDHNASFAEYYKKVLDGTANINEANLVLTKLQERQRDVKGEDLKLINQTISSTQKYVDGLQKIGTNNVKSTGSKSPVKETVQALNTEQQILKQIADIESKLAIETLPLQSKEFEKQIVLLQSKLSYLKGEYEKIDLGNAEPKSIVNPKIQSRSERGDNSPGKISQFAESIGLLRSQIIALGAIDGVVNGLTSSFGGLFAAFVPPQGADTPLKNFLKSVVNSIISAVQASILAATGFSAAQSVLTFGISLLKDAPLLAAALVALEAAKGFVNGFKLGGYTGDGDENEPAGVVHKGEFVIKKSRVRSLIDNFGTGFLSFLNGGGLVPNLSGGYASGGIVTALTNKPTGDFFEANISGEFTDAMKVEFYKNGKKLSKQFDKAVRISNS